MKNLKLQQLDKQQGAVLVMALVMLTVLTLIGVSSMSSSTLELKVAGNTQQHDIAFQAAQSIIDVAASEDPANTNNYQVFKTDPAQAGFKQIINYASSDGEASAQAETFWVGCKKNIGNSLEEGKAPESLTSWKEEGDKRAMTRPICPYPQMAHYTGKGDTNEARNFECR